MPTSLSNVNIPIDNSLSSALENENIHPKSNNSKKRLLYISGLAILIGILMSIVAKVLLLLIFFITNLFYNGKVSFETTDLIQNHVGVILIFIPAIGGLVAGLMAYYGSRGIQGHGIPEAMEQVLTNKSKINPMLTFLKPISSAIVIGTGSPFGAEGPIIATGGALGSTLGQYLKITSRERKILLAAGAAAGTAAIFGTPIAALFLAIELLLFEYAPRSIIPCALACITATAGCHFLILTGPIFPIEQSLAIPSNTALMVYSVIGIIMGFFSIAITKAVYWIEDLYYKIPIHWMWYPIIGGLIAGVIGYFSPKTLGVGYENITDILNDKMATKTIILLVTLKLFSWLFSLSSGTSGGTLAPMMTIGGGLGVFLGVCAISLFPNSGVSLPMAALVGMMALFAGASRALLTSIVFGIESTSQFNGLLPLLAACTASFCISYFLMKNTIMTEKIARRGVKTPDSFEPDLLEEISVGRIINTSAIAISEGLSISKTEEIIKNSPNPNQNFFIVSNDQGAFKGIINCREFLECKLDKNTKLSQSKLIKEQDTFILENDNLKEALEIMLLKKLDVLPVVSNTSKMVKGVISYTDILDAFKMNYEDNGIPRTVFNRRLARWRSRLNYKRKNNKF